MGNIRGIQFPNQKLTAADHRTIIAKAITDGKLNGCELTFSGNTLTIGTGAFLISGGQVSITSAETAQFTQTSGYGRLIAEIDLSGTATRTSWEQFSWSVDYAATADGFTALTKENINTGSGTIYQIEFAVVSLSASGITEIVRQLDNAEGGGGNVYAFIVATYPSGSTCTCTNGTKTLRAKDTTGSWVFNIPSAGTWTVSCTDGTETESKNVVISSQGQSESVTLSYVFYIMKNGILLYGDNNQFTCLGMKPNSSASSQAVSPTATYNADNIYLNESASSSASGLAYVNHQFTVGENTVIKAVGTFNACQSGTLGMNLRLYSSIGAYLGTNQIGNAGITQGATATELSVSLTGISTFYCGFAMAYNGSASNATITDIWLE